MARTASRGGLRVTATAQETARAFAVRYGRAAPAVARARAGKAGAPETERYWRDVEEELGKLPPEPLIRGRLGRCGHCGTRYVYLPAELVADPRVHVCAACHANPDLHTQPRAP